MVHVNHIYLNIFFHDEEEKSSFKEKEGCTKEEEEGFKEKEEINFSLNFGKKAPHCGVFFVRGGAPLSLVFVAFRLNKARGFYKLTGNTIYHNGEEIFKEEKK